MSVTGCTSEPSGGAAAKVYDSSRLDGTGRQGQTSGVNRQNTDGAAVIGGAGRRRGLRQCGGQNSTAGMD